MATLNSPMANPKSDVRLTVHRATHQIGGNCIELDTADGHRVILDVGRPLGAPQDARHLLPKSLNTCFDDYLSWMSLIFKHVEYSTKELESVAIMANTEHHRLR